MEPQIIDYYNEIPSGVNIIYKSSSSLSSSKNLINLF